MKTMRRLLACSAAALSLPSLVQAREFQTEAVHACSAPQGEFPTVDGVVIERMESEAGDLPNLRVTVAGSGAWMKIFYDPVSETVALSRAACLGAELALLYAETGDTRIGAEWDSVIFTSDSAYAQPRDDAAQGRWLIVTQADGSVDQANLDKVIALISHEQMHDFQGRNGGRTPRWFHEGHATWIGLRVTSVLSPALGTAEIARREQALTGAEPLRLSAWGGMSVKPEALMRQLTPEDRARKLSDPTFQPSGPFSFGPDDIISDESNTPARYSGSWKIFQSLEARHGFEAVRNWTAEVTATSERMTTDQIVASAQARFGEDLAPLVR